MTTVAQYVDQLERVAAVARYLAEETDEDTYVTDEFRLASLNGALDKLESMKADLLKTA